MPQMLPSPGESDKPSSRTTFRRRGVLSVLSLAFFLSGCQTAPLPLSDQETLDRTSITLPETLPPGSPPHPRMVQVLESMGFHWNDPRFTLGHQLIRKNLVAWFDSSGNLHITRYTGIFRGNGYSIRRYAPSPSGDLEHRGTRIRSSLLLCLFNRPVEALRFHRDLSSMTLLVEVAVGGPVDMVLLPVTLPVCLLADRRPDKLLQIKKESDNGTLNLALKRYRLLTENQKGKPIPTKVTAPASVE